MGSIVAYEVACRLRDSGLATPTVIFASAHPSPDKTATDRATWMHPLPDGAFVKTAGAKGFIPEALLQSEELLQISVPPLKADLSIVEARQA